MSIIPDFIVRTPKGYYCTFGDFYLDPRQPVKHAVVSHAHADHAVAGSENVYCTPATAAIMQLRLGDKAAGNFHSGDMANGFTMGNIRISFFHAGHILGSVMVLMEHNNVRYLYTGDFKLQQDPTCPPIAFTQAEVLITETTFANPQYVHPETTTVMEALLGNGYPKITIGAYALGKAQHVTALLRHQNHYEVFIHPQIIPIHHLYERQGVALGAWKPFNQQDFRRAEKAVFIVPPAIYKRLPRKYSNRAVFATGWEQRGRDNLHISDHADWPQLMAFIGKVQPKLIYTIHGDGAFLAAHLEDSSIQVQTLPVKSKNPV